VLNANHPSFKLSIIAAILLGLAALPTATLAQHEHNTPSGFPLDWSHSHVIYRPGVNLEEVKKLETDPRYLRHQYEDRRKWEKAADNAASWRGESPKKRKRGTLTVDWAVSLAHGSVAQNMSPAKWSVTGSSTPDCTDRVVYALNVAGNSATVGGEQANLIAVDNLYGTANGCMAAPRVIFAYALTSGPIATSPVLSYYDNGAQIAFVANEGCCATLRVVKYSTAASNGTAAGAPVAYPGTGTEVNLQYSTTTNTNSSPYIDYFEDAAYVGDDAGTLYKISPVFGGGTPTVKWKATLEGQLTGPILDLSNGVVLVGSDNGTLYAVKAADGTAAGTTNTLAFGNSSIGAGIVDPPVIVAKGLGLATDVFVTTGCNVAGTLATLNEASETISGLTPLTSATIGQANLNCPSNSLHAPAFDDNAYNGLAGYVYACGTAISSTGPSGGSENPTLYSFPYPAGGGTIDTTPTSTYAPSSAATEPECSPITYFTSNSTAKIFMGIGGDSTGGVVESNTVSADGVISAATQDTTPGDPTGGLGGTSGIVVDNDSATSSLANVYFAGLTAGNVTAGGIPGNCQSFTVSGSSSGTTVTLTGTGFNFSTGNTIVVSGFTGSHSRFNGTWVVASTTGTTSLTYTDTNLNGTHNAQSNHNASWGTCGFQLTQSGLN